MPWMVVMMMKMMFLNVVLVLILQSLLCSFVLAICCTCSHIHTLKFLLNPTHDVGGIPMPCPHGHPCTRPGERRLVENRNRIICRSSYKSRQNNNNQIHMRSSVPGQGQCCRIHNNQTKKQQQRQTPPPSTTTTIKTKYTCGAVSQERSD